MDTTLARRDGLAPGLRWRLQDIYPDWASWELAFAELERRVEAFRLRRGTLARGADSLASALADHDGIEVLAHRVFWLPSLMHDEDLRRNDVAARKQRIALLLTRANTEFAWMRPEILALGLDRVRRWLDGSAELAVYRFHLEDLFRRQAHVLDEARETLLGHAGPLTGTSAEAYTMLSTADVRWPEVELVDGSSLRVTPGEYARVLQTDRVQENRRRVFEALYGTFAAHRNTYAALYVGVCHRDWFLARSRGYATTLDAALDEHAIDPGVFETLVRTTRAGVEPLRRYYRLRRRVLGVDSIHLYDGMVGLIEDESRYPFERCVEKVIASVRPLGEEYTERMREAFASGWIDVCETEGKRGGAYSAPVYGVHPYVLLNHKETRSDLFTLAHEMGHSLHTVLSHRAQPFVYSGYSVFVAEVASTLAEGLLLDHLMAESRDARERVLLLQHAIDSIAATFYAQVLFADFEREVHRRIEGEEPVTADVLDEIYAGMLADYYGTDVELDEAYRGTWARIPHLFRTPYYVYQYATCYASAAILRRAIQEGRPEERAGAVERYLELLSAGGSDHPMELLRRAGVDLSRPEPIRAVVDRLDALVTALEAELGAL